MTSFTTNIARTLDRFRNPSFGDILRLYLRALDLQLRPHRKRSGRRQCPAKSAPDRATKRVVISLSTTPARAPHLAATLASLLDQDMKPDRIILAYPRESLRNGRAYPDPATLRLPDGVDVVRCDDHGPATKLIPALALERDALLIIVDDDIAYPSDFVRSLVNAHTRHPAAVCAYRGVMADAATDFRELPHILASNLDHDTPVDIVFGSWGYLLPSWLLAPEAASFANFPASIRWVDDIWLSGILARRGIARFVVPANLYPVEIFNDWRAALSKTTNKNGENDQRAIETFSKDW